jgi:hypothetical protein
MLPAVEGWEGAGLDTAGIVPAIRNVCGVRSSCDCPSLGYGRNTPEPGRRSRVMGYSRTRDDAPPGAVPVLHQRTIAQAIVAESAVTCGCELHQCISSARRIGPCDDLEPFR